MKAAVQRANIEYKDVNDAMIGNVLAELGFAKTGRMALNHAGFPNTTTFHTVNRQCSSSLQAITHISHAIMVGQIDVGLAGGVESMSRNYGSRGVPTDVSPSLLGSTVKDSRDCLMPMGITSENVAERYNVDRKSQDEYAVRSHERASNAQKEGRFDWEIVPVTVQRMDETTGQPTGFEVTKDDGIRHGLTPVLKFLMAHHRRFWLVALGRKSVGSHRSVALLARKSVDAHPTRWVSVPYTPFLRCSNTLAPN
jgi:acetyl-CoA acyltransferase 1